MKTRTILSLVALLLALALLMPAMAQGPDDPYAPLTELEYKELEMSRQKAKSGAELTAAELARIIELKELVATLEGGSAQAPPVQYPTRQRTPDATFLTQGFELGDLPAGWTQEYVVYTSDWDIVAPVSNPSAAHGGTYVARFKIDSYDGDTTRLVTPEIDLGASTNPRLTFWLYMDDWFGDQDELRIYFKTSAAGAWSPVATYTAEVSSWTQQTVSLPNPSSSYYIAFEGSSGYGYGVHIDDIEVTDTPVTVPGLQAPYIWGIGLVVILLCVGLSIVDRSNKRADARPIN